ncbi:MAG: hypothetical protein Q8781_02130 [Candidatus Phytoplasma stylosanthis]|uniref:hypothetical protein n=1 Tax=Candidatus Phytoplasma stylosanthis TaxID=2798314 RepID=UPI00293B8366|nr:hypothetical protein [Candidatus Phytoplasma stylosanthis]MDV3168011.1 hypothetical protein [Candidatus Phytoplasma stylosanthis]MDV3171082.1 hypothetical protein [Candidatus Phytoplasma stylosanthis]MDV3173743.1 hypothetical protein [Candidatus Phytoplasma stylosanthis]MDV3174256.1 hypothetical protein [Candidatus Phytoplasma stylosanthis]MDV3202630.1 hypothetical protein [Candidatus Phytoplasma stylosanthis]
MTIKIKNNLKNIIIFLFILFIPLLLLNDNIKVKAIENNLNDIKPNIWDYKLKLFDSIVEKNKIEEIIFYYKNKVQINLEDKKNINILEKKIFQINQQIFLIKQKISEPKSIIKKNKAKNIKKVTFDLKPYIKIIE